MNLKKPENINCCISSCKVSYSLLIAKKLQQIFDTSRDYLDNKWGVIK